MTTYQEAADIALDLKDKGIAYQVMNFQGWSNGGYYADVYDRITGLSKLGGKKKLEALNDTMESIGGRLYVDVPFQDVTYISKRYNRSFETSRYYGAGYVARFGAHNPANLRITSSLGYDENIYDLISPKYLQRYVDAFIKKNRNRRRSYASSFSELLVVKSGDDQKVKKSKQRRGKYEQDTDNY